jgi:phage gp36-like protein
MYVTLAELADRPGPSELSQVATPLRVPAVDAGLLDALLRGEPVSAWAQDDVQVGLEALEVILSAVSDAGAIIDGYLRRRGYTLPLASRFGIVTGWARAIARYLLHKDRLSAEGTDPIVRDYRDALKFLQLVADGKFSLGQDDPVAPAGGGSPEVVAAPRIFSRDTLKDF